MVEEKYLRVADAARRFGITPQAIYQWIARGELRRYKPRLGGPTRISVKELQDALAVRPVDPIEGEENADAGQP